MLELMVIVSPVGIAIQLGQQKILDDTHRNA
jgi:hypothetical protein